MQETTKKESEVIAKVDLVLRSLLHRLIIPQELSSRRVNNFFSLVLSLACEELCNGPLPILLLNELMDCKTVSECEILFEFLERNVSTLKSDALFSKVKIVILRGCNDLLRRLYPNQDMIFSGRILIFLANFFYIYERSGLNLTSEFHTDSGMFYSYENDEENADLDNNEENEKARNISNSFFINFWQLQDFFRNPANSVRERGFETMQKCCDIVLEIFRSSNVNIDSDLHQDIASIDDNKQREGFLLRYLTSRKLFEIQLGDSTFRRQILLQMIILLQYFTSTIKFRPAYLNLTNEQESWIKSSEEKAYKLLLETDRDGKKFCKSVEDLFKREENWSNWKNEQCPEIVAKKAKIESSEETATTKAIKGTHLWITKRTGFIEQFFKAKEHGKTLVGTVEMNKLWNYEPNNMAACTSKDRDFTPNKEDHFGFILELPEKDREKNIRSSNFIWSSFRLLGEQGNSFFVPKNWRYDTNKTKTYSIQKYLADHINASTGDPRFAEDEA